MNTIFILIVIFTAPNNNVEHPNIGTVFKQEFSTQAGCLSVLEIAFKQPEKVKAQIINAGCYPLK